MSIDIRQRSSGFEIGYSAAIIFTTQIRTAAELSRRLRKIVTRQISAKTEFGQAID